MSDQAIQLMHGDCLLLLPMLPDHSVDLILTDPPYMGVKSERWDNQWSSSAAFLDWLGEVLKQFHRVLRPNGSLYLFASPQMSARVECKVGEVFNVINRITWRKPPFSTKAEMFRKEDLRSFYPASESIIFAEHFGEPLRAYLEEERLRSGTDKMACNVACGFSASAGGMASRHYFSRSQWQMPTLEHYTALQVLFNARGGEFLRQKYEDLRRPFVVSPDVPYTDVWDFETVGVYPGKHPCEKPLPLLRHIITTSSRLGAVVLDAFAGSASTGVACLETGRQFIGMEQDANYYRQGQIRLTGQTLSLFTG